MVVVRVLAMNFNEQVDEIHFRPPPGAIGPYVDNLITTSPNCDNASSTHCSLNCNPFPEV